MPSIVFDNISALDKKSSETDINKNTATVLTNLSTTKKPGALVKDGAYTDVSSSLVGADLPSGLTRKNLFQMALTRPSNTDIYLAHVTDSNSKNRIYVGKYWDGSVFQSDWRELTEHEGPYTLVAADITAGTNANQLVVDDDNTDFTDLSTTNDYYNGWFLVVDIAAKVKTACLITDYTVTATTKTFDVIDASLTGIAASDTFSLARSLVFADGIGKSSSGAPPRYADIAQIDDSKIIWKGRENVAIGMTGNAREFPTQFQLWYGYIKNNYGNTDEDGGTTSIDDFYLELQQLIKPFVTESPPSNEQSVIEASASGGGSDLTTGDWKLYAAYEYDGFQIGSLSSSYTVTVSSGNSIFANIRVPLIGCYDGTSVTISSFTATATNKHVRAYETGDETDYAHSSLVSRRVSAVRLYAQTPDDDNIYFVRRYIISYSDTFEAKAPPLALTDDLVMVYADSGIMIGVTGAIAQEATQVTGNQTYTQQAGQENLETNFRYGNYVGSHFVAAAIRNRNGLKQDNDLIASIIDGAGVAAIDAFGASNLINLGHYGGSKITGTAILGDDGKDVSPKISQLVFTDDEYYVLTLTPGSSFSFNLDNVGSKEGLVAPDSLFFAEGQILGVSRNGFRIYTPRGTQIIGEGLKTDFDALTDPSDCMGAYFKKERLGIFHFPTDNKTYAIDLLSGNLNMFEYSLADTFAGLTSQRNGDLLAVDTDKIFQFGSGTTQDNTTFTPTVRTKRFNASDMNGKDGEEIIFTDGFIKYKSDTAITLNFYLNNSGTAITFPNLSLPAKTDDLEVKFKMPKGARGHEAEAELTLSSSQKTSNTSFEFNRLRFDGYFKRRL